MTKKETIWRHILQEGLEHKRLIFTQKGLAKLFCVSTSTVHSALKAPRKLGAVEVTGRFFRLRDSEKLLLLWATQRNLERDILYATHVDATAPRMEGLMPQEVIFGAFSAYRLKYQEAPADYDLVYVYSDKVQEIQKRFPKQKGRLNLFVLKKDPHFYGAFTPDVQTFVDLWNIPVWYAKAFLDALKLKFQL